MPISPGPATDTGSPASLFEQRAADPYKNAKEITNAKGANSTVTSAQAFEQRVQDAGNTTH
jgi:hypothetical protein